MFSPIEASLTGDLHNTNKLQFTLRIPDVASTEITAFIANQAYKRRI